MASIGMLLEGIPSVAVDNAPALREGLRHLVRVHGHRRIAFVRGPAGNQEAEERYRVYREVLAEHEIPLDPALIAPGDFTMPAGTAAVRALIDERRASFQALVAARNEFGGGAAATSAGPPACLPRWFPEYSAYAWRRLVVALHPLKPA